MEVQKASLQYAVANANRPVTQSQVEQNKGLPDAKWELESQKDGKTERSRQEQTSISMIDIKESIKPIVPSNTHLAFTIDEHTGETVISIIDDKSGEVIRRIPPNEVSEMKKRMIEIYGILFDAKV